METFTSKQILESEDLYELQDSFGSLGIPFKYQLTVGERGWLDFVSGRYSIADWIIDNLDHTDLTLTFNCPMEMSQALDDDCGGFGKAVCLSDDTALQKLFFWLYTETGDDS